VFVTHSRIHGRGGKKHGHGLAGDSFPDQAVQGSGLLDGVRSALASSGGQQ
jgi:hypothetical protein